MEIRKILKRFTKQQLISDVWQILNVLNVKKPDSQRSTKEEMISYMIKVATDASLDMKKLHVLLEMKSCQVQTERRQWQAVEIINPKFFVEKKTVPEKFAKKLSKYLNRSQFFCEVVSEFLNDVMWTAVSVKHLKSQANIFYLLAYVNLPILLHSYVRPNYQQIICRSLVELFNGTNCETFSMKSKNINTLFLCVSHKIKTIDNIEEKLPIQRRKRPEKDNLAILPMNVINEDYNEDEQRKSYLQETFGAFEQPAIDTLTYDVSTDFFGFDDNDDEKPIVGVTRTVFKGENVLEGLQQLVEEGIADIPLPEYMTQAVHYGTRINIKQNYIQDNF